MAGVLVVVVMAVVSQLVTAPKKPVAGSTQQKVASSQSPQEQRAQKRASGAVAPAGAGRASTGASASGAAAAGASTPPSAQTPQASADNINEKSLTFSDGPTKSAVKAAPAVGIWDLVRMVLILAFVVALIYGLFYLLKKSTGGRLSEASSMRILGNLQLPGNRTVHLIEAGRQVFLVGGAEHSVNLIAEITDPESLDDIRLKYQTATPGVRKNFSDLLSGVLAAAGFPHHQNNLSHHANALEAGREPAIAESPPGADGGRLRASASAPTVSASAPTEPTQFLRQQRDRLKRLSQ